MSITLGDFSLEEWKRYFEGKQEKGSLNPFFKESVALLGDDAQEFIAWDVGCGIGFEAAHLVEKGFKRVDCLDAFAFLEEYIRINSPQALEEERITFQADTIENYQPQQSYELVTALASLFFTEKKEVLNQTMAKVLGAVAPGGHFIGSFFGLEHTWNGKRNILFLTEGEIKEYFQGFDIAQFTELHDRHDYGNGMADYHIFYIHAKKQKI